MGYVFLNTSFQKHNRADCSSGQLQLWVNIYNHKSSMGALTSRWKYASMVNIWWNSRNGPKKPAHWVAL